MLFLSRVIGLEVRQRLGKALLGDLYDVPADLVPVEAVDHGEGDVHVESAKPQGLQGIEAAELAGAVPASAGHDGQALGEAVVHLLDPRVRVRVALQP